MPITPEIRALVDRLNREIDLIEQSATEGLNRARPILYQFPENARLIQMFATLNNSLLFADNSRKRTQIIVESISPTNVAAEVFQEAAEDLGELLGRLLEVKILVNGVVTVLEDLA
ncbi:MAG: restriction endonuclease subunit S [Oscillatoria sp. SIO1A7]|nr:restriction endonuclease subunit S [Oscillatoria sp. SIO1A7]